MLYHVKEGCTTGVVGIKGKLHLFKTNDIRPESKEDKPYPVLLPDQENELKEDGINFPGNWPKEGYVAIGIVCDWGDRGKWISLAGGISKNIAFGAASAHTVKATEDMDNWELKKWDMYNSLRQGSLGMSSLEEVEGACKNGVLEINMYTNYVYCTKKDAMAVEFNANHFYLEKLKKKFLLRTNHYQFLCNDREPRLEDPDLSLSRYNQAHKGLQDVGSVIDLMKLLCSGDIPFYSNSGMIGCVETGEFWYSLKKPESPGDFQKIELKNQ